MRLWNRLTAGSRWGMQNGQPFNGAVLDVRRRAATYSEASTRSGGEPPTLEAAAAKPSTLRASAGKRGLMGSDDI